jgi:hypothetical protein
LNKGKSFTISSNLGKDKFMQLEFIGYGYVFLPFTQDLPFGYIHKYVAILVSKLQQRHEQHDIGLKNKIWSFSFNYKGLDMGSTNKTS